MKGTYGMQFIRFFLFQLDPNDLNIIFKDCFAKNFIVGTAPLRQKSLIIVNDLIDID